jgi:hypothetical protein
MYFKTSSFPALKNLEKQQQNELVLSAVQEHNKWISIRFYFVTALLFGSAFLTSELQGTLLFPTGIMWVVFSLIGLCFYGYLLWEINGAVLKAVTLKLLKKEESL